MSFKCHGSTWHYFSERQLWSVDYLRCHYFSAILRRQQRRRVELGWKTAARDTLLWKTAVIAGMLSVKSICHGGKQSLLVNFNAILCDAPACFLKKLTFANEGYMYGTLRATASGCKQRWKVLWTSLKTLISGIHQTIWDVLQGQYWYNIFVIVDDRRWHSIFAQLQGTMIDIMAAAKMEALALLEDS